MSAGAVRKPSGAGRVAAALIGGSFLSFAIGLFVTIYIPGFDGLDEAFLGGLSLVVIWPVVMLWVLFATTAWRAWKRALIPFLIILAFNVAGLLL
ncbi:MAG: hypothetical protein AAGD38_23820 [Acidobacteriota bacterium]